MSAESGFEHALGTLHRQLLDERPGTRIRLEQEVAIRRCHRPQDRADDIDEFRHTPFVRRPAIASPAWTPLNGWDRLARKWPPAKMR